MLNRKGQIKSKGIVIAIVLLVIILVSTFVFAWWYTKNRPEINPIMLIDNDDDFAKYELPGIGTKGDPYRIEDIQMTDYLQIVIKDTTKFFTIQNCVMENSAGIAIQISNVTDGTAVIRDNSFNDNYNGVFNDFINITKAPECGITNNEFFSDIAFTSVKGLSLYYSNNSIIENNRFIHVERAIELYRSNDSIITRNELIYCAFDAGSAAVNIEASNNVSVSENLIAHSFGGISCQNSENNFLVNNTILNCNYAIGLVVVKYCTISQNVINSSLEIALHCLIIERNIFCNNTISNSFGDGMYLSGGRYNNVTFNTFSNCTYYAMRFSTTYNNSIWYNNFIENNSNGTIVGATKYYNQAYDNYYNNWHIASLSIGNYWSDFLWNSTATYAIDGGSNEDLYPLEFPV